MIVSDLRAPRGVQRIFGRVQVAVVRHTAFLSSAQSGASSVRFDPVRPWPVPSDSWRIASSREAHRPCRVARRPLRRHAVHRAPNGVHPRGALSGRRRTVSGERSRRPALGATETLAALRIVRNSASSVLRPTHQHRNIVASTTLHSHVKERPAELLRRFHVLDLLLYFWIRHMLRESITAE